MRQLPALSRMGLYSFHPSYWRSRHFWSASSDAVTLILNCFSTSMPQLLPLFRVDLIPTFLCGGFGISEMQRLWGQGARQVLERGVHCSSYPTLLHIISYQRSRCSRSAKKGCGGWAGLFSLTSLINCANHGKEQRRGV